MNAAGTATSTAATLTVIDPPVFTSEPVSRTNVAQTTATFSVTATGTSPTYHWYKNVTNLLVDGGSISGSASNVLTISNVLAADQAAYSVVVSNAAGVLTSTNAQLVVIDPAILVQPHSVTNIDGSTVMFSVTAAGTAPLHYQWQQFAGNLPGATASVLTLTNISDSDAGTYTVIVSNSAGTVTSDPAELVTVPPLIVTQPTNITVNYLQPASFSVGVNGASPFTYQWLKNGTPISGATNRIFTIPSSTLADVANYQVIVSNVDGTETSQMATLNVLVPPSVFSIVGVTNGHPILSVSGAGGFTYAIQGANNLSSPVWIPLVTNTAPYTFVDTNNVGLNYRFYRAQFLH